MEANGSRPPEFRFDEQCTYFEATLPAHPEYVALSAMKDIAHLRAVGEDEDAHRRLLSARRRVPDSGVLAVEAIRSHGGSGEIELAAQVREQFSARNDPPAAAPVEIALAEVLIDDGDRRTSKQLLESASRNAPLREAVEASKLARRAGDHELAHRILDRPGREFGGNSRAIAEFARTKLELARERKTRCGQDALNDLVADAARLLHEAPKTRDSRESLAWAWREVARVCIEVGGMDKLVSDAYAEAVQLSPNERLRLERNEWERARKDTREE